jgi:hypothetical protein
MSADNQIYYFEIGKGKWQGSFRLVVKQWKVFWSEHLSVRNRFLVLSMALFQKVTGKSVISSDLRAYPDRGTFGVATNSIRIYKWGITLYLLQEEYRLDPDGTHVTVKSKDRFGPVPFLFHDAMEYPAVIHSGGMSSNYYMPLLGANWVCSYQIQVDRNQVNATLKCNWAEANESIERISASNQH